MRGVNKPTSVCSWASSRGVRHARGARGCRNNVFVGGAVAGGRGMRLTTNVICGTRGGTGRDSRGVASRLENSKE